MGDGALEAGDSFGQGFAFVLEFADSFAEDLFGGFAVVEILEKVSRKVSCGSVSWKKYEGKSKKLN